MLLTSVFFTICGDVLIEPLLGSDAIAHIFIYAFAPAIIPLTCLYYTYLYHPFVYKPKYLLWIALPVITATSSLILTLVIGLEGTDDLLDRIHAGDFNPRDPMGPNLEHLYYYWTIVLFRGILFAEIVFFTIYSGILTHRLHLGPRNSHRFLFHQQPIRLMEVQMVIACLLTFTICLKLFLHSSMFHDNKAWAYSIALLHSILYFLLGLFALFGSKEYIYLRDIKTLLRYNYTPETRASVTEEIITDMAGDLSGDSLTRVLSRLGTQRGVTPGREGAGRGAAVPSLSATVLNIVSHMQDESGLLAEFRQLMQHDRIFLQPSLSLADVAQRLGTNKTYVSKMVNQNYKMGFPELMNILRVDYAQRYIRSHPDASQEQIAKACGFLSASSFNSTFKRITGFTPKVWTARKDSAGR
ncbi:MAG: helix-turn-helix transcriptional regulator [Clostridia bacterium]|nr:helix-turn-helix transcriptional regulator [Clostridia bacterium]